jgi:hypothetical protein
MEPVTLYAGARVDQVDLTDCTHWVLRDSLRLEDLALDDPESRQLFEGFLLRQADDNLLEYRILIRATDGRYLMVAQLPIPSGLPRFGPKPRTARHQQVSRATARRLLLQSRDPSDLDGEYDLPSDLRDIVPTTVEPATSAESASIESENQSVGASGLAASLSPGPQSLDSRAVGLAHEILAEGRAIIVAEVARKLGKERTSLYDLPGFRALLEQDRASRDAAKQRRPRGTCDRLTGSVEAWLDVV